MMFRKLRNGMTVAAVSSALLVSSCTTVPIEDDPSDQCNGFRQQIASARRTEINERIGGAAAGAIGAALITAVTGGDGDDFARNIAVGALSGFALTYFNQKRQQARDRNSLLASVNSDAQAERSLVSKTGRAASQLRSCRQQEIRTLSAEIRRGSIDQSTARARLAGIKRKIASDNQIISSTFGGINQRVDAYISATAATAEVDKSLIVRQQRQQARGTEKQRRSAAQARARTPQVTSVAREAEQQEAADAARRASVDRDIKALEALLS